MGFVMHLFDLKGEAQVDTGCTDSEVWEWCVKLDTVAVDFNFVENITHHRHINLIDILSNRILVGLRQSKTG